MRGSVTTVFPRRTSALAPCTKRPDLARPPAGSSLCQSSRQPQGAFLARRATLRECGGDVRWWRATGERSGGPLRAYRFAEQRIWLQERLSATTCLDLPFPTTRPGARSSPSDSTRKKKHRSNNARLTPNVVCVSKEVTEARRWGPSSAVGLQVAHLPASLCQRNDASSGAQLHLPKEHAHRWLRGVLLGTVCFHRLFGHGAQDGGRHSHLLREPFTKRCHEEPWPRSASCAAHGDSPCGVSLLRTFLDRAFWHRPTFATSSTWTAYSALLENTINRLVRRHEGSLTCFGPFHDVPPLIIASVVLKLLILSSLILSRLFHPAIFSFSPPHQRAPRHPPERHTALTRDRSQPRSAALYSVSVHHPTQDVRPIHLLFDVREPALPCKQGANETKRNIT